MPRRGCLPPDDAKLRGDQPGPMDGVNPFRVSQTLITIARIDN